MIGLTNIGSRFMICSVRSVGSELPIHPAPLVTTGKDVIVSRPQGHGRERTNDSTSYSPVKILTQADTCGIVLLAPKVNTEPFSSSAGFCVYAVMLLRCKLS